MPSALSTAKHRFIDFSNPQDREIVDISQMARVHTIRDMQGYKSQTSVDVDGETVFFEVCRPLLSTPMPTVPIPKQVTLDEGCISQYAIYFEKYHEATGCGNLRCVRMADKDLSVGYPDKYECAWQIQADGTPVDGRWDPNTLLTQICHDPSGNEINKNHLQFFSGIPCKVS